MTMRQPVHELSGQPVGDDFTRIHGIGPAIANRLQHAGILRYTQLASLSAEEIVAAAGGLIGLTVERVEQQDWAGQARALSNAEMEPLTDDSGARLHYATFTTELLLDENRRVRRTRLVDVRAGKEGAWAGWAPERLVRFIVDQSGLLVEAEPVGELTEMEAAGLPAEEQKLPSSMEIEAVSALDASTSAQTHMLPANTPFTLKLNLSLSGDRLPAGAGLICRATVQAKDLSNGEHQILADWDDFIPADEHVDLYEKHPGLPHGIYRLEAAAMINRDGESNPPEVLLAAFLEGEILQVI